MYNRFGPTARICFELPKRKSHLDEHRHRFEAALSSLSSRVLQGMATGIFNIDMSDISLTILLLKRLPGDEFSRSTVEIITPTTEMAVRDQFSKETLTELINLFRSLARVDWSRCLASVVYGMSAQQNLLKENPFNLNLNLVTMVRRTPDGSGPIKKPPLPQWYSDHRYGNTSSRRLSMNIYVTGIDVFDPKTNTIKTNVYYKLCQAAVDSFVMYNNQLYIFQFTVATEHDIDKGILTLFSQVSLPPRRNWHFVFVFPHDLLDFSFPQGRGEMKEFLEEIQLHCMQYF